MYIYIYVYISMGFPGGASGKEPTCQYRRCKRRRIDPWVRKIPWRRTEQPTPVFLPTEAHGQRSKAGCSPWDMTASDLAHTHISIHRHTHTHIYLYTHTYVYTNIHNYRILTLLISLFRKKYFH